MTTGSKIVSLLAFVALASVLAWLGHRTGDDETSAPPATTVIASRTRQRVDRPAARPDMATDGVLHGTLLHEERLDPAIDCPVRLFVGSELIAEVTTDGVGQFTLVGVPSNTPLDVRIDVDGCAPIHIPVLELSAGERRDLGFLALGAARTIHVIVTDEAGDAVPGTVVEFYREPPGVDMYARTRALVASRPRVTTHLDSSGRADVQLPPSDYHTVVAHAPGYARVAEAQMELLVDNGGELHLVLPPAHRLNGVVVDRGGEPVVNGHVLAQAHPRVTNYRDGWTAIGTARWHRARTDVRGAFVFEDLAPGSVELVWSRDGDLPGGDRSALIPEIDNVRLVLLPTTRVVGRVVDLAGGAGIAGVAVRYGSGQLSGVTVSDADGRWLIAGVPVNSNFRAEAVAPQGWIAVTDFGRRVIEGEHLGIDIVLRRAARVTGTVRMDGVPIGGAWVRAVTVDEESGRTLHGASIARSNARGRYRIDDILPGRVFAWAVPPLPRPPDAVRALEARLRSFLDPDEPGALESIPIAAGAAAQLDLEASLPDDFEPWAVAQARGDEEGEVGMRRVRVHGRVTTSDGLSLRAARVFVGRGVPPTPIWMAEFEPSWLVRVDQNGRFETEVLVNVGTDVVHACAVDSRHTPAFGLVGVPAATGEEGVVVNVELPPLPVVHGTVVSAGRPLAGASIFWDGAEVARTATDGAFTFARSEGESVVGILAEGFVRVQAEIEMPQTLPVLVELQPARVLTGVVVNADGEPVAGVVVSPVDDNGDLDGGYAAWWYSDQPTPPITGADGRFGLTELPPTPVYLRLSEAPDGTAASAVFRAGPFGAGAEDVRVVTRPPRSLSGSVTGPDGVPVEPPRVIRIVLVPGALVRAAGGTYREAALTANGTWALDGLHVGEYMLHVIPRRGTGLQPAQFEIGAAQETVELTLEPAAVISGAIVGGNGSPMRRARLRLRPLGSVPDGPARWDPSVQADSDGRFRLFVRTGISYAIELDRWEELYELTGGKSVLAGASGVRLVARRLADMETNSARAAGTVKGTVLSRRGDAVANATVLVVTSGSMSETTSGADGAFSVTGLASEDGKVSVIVYADGLAATQFDDILIGNVRLRVSLRLERTIAGRLLTSDGAPAVGYRVRALRDSNSSHDLWRADPDAEGNFTLHGLARGTWRLEAIVERGGVIRAVVPLGLAKGGAKGLELRLSE